MNNLKESMNFLKTLITEGASPKEIKLAETAYKKLKRGGREVGGKEMKKLGKFLNKIDKMENGFASVAEVTHAEVGDKYQFTFLRFETMIVGDTKEEAEKLYNKHIKGFKFKKQLRGEYWIRIKGYQEEDGKFGIRNVGAMTVVSDKVRDDAYKEFKKMNFPDKRKNWKAGVNVGLKKLLNMKPLRKR